MRAFCILACRISLSTLCKYVRWADLTFLHFAFIDVSRRFKSLGSLFLLSFGEQVWSVEVNYLLSEQNFFAFVEHLIDIYFRSAVERSENSARIAGTGGVLVWGHLDHPMAPTDERWRLLFLLMIKLRLRLEAEMGGSLTCKPLMA